MNTFEMWIVILQYSKFSLRNRNSVQYSKQCVLLEATVQPLCQYQYCEMQNLKPRYRNLLFCYRINLGGRFLSCFCSLLWILQFFEGISTNNY